jgi:hypothetical protein
MNNKILINILYMSIQIFKNIIPTTLLYEVLDKICIKTPKYYILNNDAFKKGVFNEELSNFLKTCTHYYHVSKRKYLEKPLTYNSFVTVIRQICNFNKITYKSHIKYDKSTYNIVYNIYY